MATYKPFDYLKGSKTLGQNYTAWDTYGQGKPDFGKAKGPGDPYHEITKKVRKPTPGAPGSGKPLPWGIANQSTTPKPSWLPAQVASQRGNENSAWINAVRRRLQGG